MQYFNWAIRVPFLLVAFAFVYLTAPLWAAIAAVFKFDNIPLISTLDDTIYGDRYCADRRISQAVTMWQRFTYATWWLYRNPAHGFSGIVLGYPEDDIDHTSWWEEDGWKGHDTYLVQNVRRWGRTNDNWHGIKVRLGWGRSPQGGYHLIKCSLGKGE